MARNIAKRFATMTLLYWEPEITGSGVKYTAPVKFKGFFIGDARFVDGSVSDMIFSGTGERRNLVLFYMQQTDDPLFGKKKPEPQGYVSWFYRYEVLESHGHLYTAPGELSETHLIKDVATYPMIRTKMLTDATTAWIASVV